ncbi:MAG: hypothetical protein V4662_21545 [Verrucomicrobiota bacterium]
MTTATHLYIPHPWHTSVPEVLSAAGFQVTVRHRDLPDGGLRLDYDCSRGAEKFYLGEVPLAGDSSHRFILGLYRPKHLSAFRSACDALMERGALDEVGYGRQKGKV